MSHQFALTARAEADVDRIFNELADVSPEGAGGWYEAFGEGVRGLKANPCTCGLAHENRIIAEELRHLLFATRRGRTYRAPFVVRGDVATILRVRAPGERPVTPRDLGP
jgi:plasmid stabilization system protein ParE